MTNTNQSTIEQHLPRKKKSYSGFMAFSFVMMVILSIVALLPLISHDFFPFLRIGEEIIKTGHIPSTEFMTYTRFGNPAVYSYWLSSLFLLAIYKLGGVFFVKIISILCVGGLFTLLWFCLRELKIGTFTSALVLIFIAFDGSLYFYMRPEILTYLLFGIEILIMIRWQKGGERHLWVLPILALLWVNIHGSFIIFFLILFPALIFGSGNRKQLAIFTGISLLSTLFNFYGFELWTNMFSMVNNQSIGLIPREWKPPVNQGWQLNLFFIKLLVTPVLVAISKPKIKIIYWLWYLGFGWMALTAYRYIIWFLPFEALLLSMLIDPFLKKQVVNSNRFQNRNINVVLSVLMLLFPIALLPGVRNKWWPQSPQAFYHATPLEAAIWIKENPQLPDNLWSDFIYSTYLTYEIPQRKVFMSNRLEDFSIDLIEENFQIDRAAYNWQSLLEKYNINMVMPSINNQPDLIKALSYSPEWIEIYRDQQAVIFLRHEQLDNLIIY
jgi:hypothetical protein